MTKKSRDSSEQVHIIVVQSDDLPVIASQIAEESLRAIFMKAIQHSCWPTDSIVDVNLFYKRRLSLV